MLKLILTVLLLSATSSHWQTTAVSPEVTVEAPDKLVGGSAHLPPGIKAYLILKQGDVIYGAAEFDGTDQPPQEMLDGFTTGMVHPGRGTLEWQKPIDSQGWPGREVQYSEPGLMKHRFRAFVVGKKIIQVEVTWRPAGDVPTSTPRFLSSLKLPRKR